MPVAPKQKPEPPLSSETPPAVVEAPAPFWDLGNPLDSLYDLVTGAVFDAPAAAVAAMTEGTPDAQRNLPAQAQGAPTGEALVTRDGNTINVNLGSLFRPVKSAKPQRQPGSVTPPPAEVEDPAAE